MTTIGFIGAGHIGGALAQLAIAQGYDVVVSNSRGPETLTDLVQQLGDRARAGTSAEAAAAGDVVVVTIPTKNVQDVPVEPLAGKVVIDTNNYYPQRDGQIPALDDESTTVSELLQTHLPAVARGQGVQPHRVRRPRHAGRARRHRRTVARSPSRATRTRPAPRWRELIDELGFDTVDVGPLAEGWRYQRDTAAYVQRFDADGLRAALAKAVRYRDM